MTETNQFVIVFQLRVFACRKCPNRFHFCFFFFYGASTLFLALSFPISVLQHSLFLPDAIQFHICSKSAASHQQTSPHLPLGLPTDLLTPQHPPNTFSGIRESSILVMWPVHWSRLYFRNFHDLMVLILVVISTVSDSFGVALDVTPFGLVGTKI